MIKGKNLGGAEEGKRNYKVKPRILSWLFGGICQAALHLRKADWSGTQSCS